jgi:hypothetical protein
MQERFVKVRVRMRAKKDGERGGNMDQNEDLRCGDVFVASNISRLILNYANVQMRRSNEHKATLNKSDVVGYFPSHQHLHYPRMLMISLALTMLPSHTL